MTSLRGGLVLGFVSLTLLCAASTPAQAGFQWVDQSGVERSSDQMPSMASSAPIAAQPLPSFPEPQIIEAAPPPAPKAMAPAAKLQTLEPPADIASAEEPASEEKGKVVRGFASNIPLSVALRQVLPQEYSFSVAQDVSLGTQVSWKGGTEWRAVLKDMLAPVGLSAKEDGASVQIVRASIGSMGSLSSASAGSKTSGDEQPSLQPEDDDRPMSLTSPAETKKPRRAKFSTEPLPSRHVGGGAGAMGYLAPPEGVAPSPSYAYAGANASGGGGLVGASRTGVYDAWTASKGEMLHRVLEDWCRRAGVELSWQAEYDYPLQASVLLSGSFEDAVRNLLAGFQEARPQPTGQLFSNNMAGQAVLVVQARGNNYND